MKKLCVLVLFCGLAFWVRAQEFRFALVTDLHVVAADSLAANDLRRAVAQINATPGIAFVIAAGDFSEEGDRASLLKAKEILDGLHVKYYATSGNHETKWSESGATDFGHIFGSDRFRFEYEGILFLGFNSGPVIRMAEGHVAPQDIGWLREELSAAGPEKPVVLVTHYPLMKGDVDNWYEVTDAVRGYNIRAVLCGHYHTDGTETFDGIPGLLNRTTLRGKEPVGGYSLYEITPDSIRVYEHKIGGQPRFWGGYSLTETYFTGDNAGYFRPDFSVNERYPQVRSLWKTAVGGAVYSSPVLYKNKVYVGDDLGVLTCFSVRGGRRLWSFKTDNRIVGTPAADNGVIVFGSADKNIYGLSARDGVLLWKVPCGEAVLGAVTIRDGVAYIGSSDGAFRALDIRTGKTVWQYEGVRGYVETRPLVCGGKVFFGAWDNNMYALDQRDGRLLWKWDGGHTRMHYSPAAVWPVADRGRLFFTAPDRVMTALDMETGREIWRTGQSKVRETIGVSQDGKRLYSKTMQDSLVCYSAEGDTPREVWSSSVGFGYELAPSMPVERGGVVFGSTMNGEIFAVEALTGRLLWRHKIANSLISTVVPLDGSSCLYTCTDGSVGLLRAGKVNTMK